MPRLSATDIYGYARGAGFDHEEAVRFTAIALAESGGDPRAVGDVGLQTGTWGPSVGLWQVRSLKADRGTGRVRDELANLDPAVNARAAYEISDGGRTMQPWSTAHQRGGRPASYEKHLDDARAGAAAWDGSVPGPAGLPEHVRPVEDARLVDSWHAPRSGGRLHEGIDIFAPEGTPIRAVSGGRIVGDFENEVGGVVVRIQGDDGNYYYYAHLKEGSTDELRVGQRVRTGDVIGEVGRTGNAATTPPHLHLQVKVDGAWVNPYDFLSPFPDWDEVRAPRPDGAAEVPAAGGGQQREHDPGEAFALPAASPVRAADTDDDGLTDEFERLLTTDVEVADTDHDGLSDAYESTVSHSDPLEADTDGDGETDGLAVAQGHDPGRVQLPVAVRGTAFGGLATADTDNDGLDDAYEARIGTSPTAADTDRDELTDGFEVAQSLDPLALDSDRDGLTDTFAAEHLTGTPDGGLPAGPAEPVPSLGEPPGATPFGDRGAPFPPVTDPVEAGVPLHDDHVH